MKTKQNITKTTHYVLVLLLIGFTLSAKAQFIDEEGTTYSSFTVNANTSIGVSSLRLNGDEVWSIYNTDILDGLGIGRIIDPPGTQNAAFVSHLILENGGVVKIPKALTVGTDEAIPGTIAHFDGRVYISENDGVHEGFDDHTDDKYKDFLLWVEEGIVTSDLALADLEDWPDYVFDKDYNLPSLEEVENNIKKTGHLHTMPSAEVVEKSGFEVSDMTKRMVKTIEELTLHTINQKKQIDMLMARLAALEAKLK
ncbi:hypothetical protein [Flavivirga jejuensis]|uniref:Uncharacterized protein n=1 Tax=Flavivirga jejuensis TaxID=870487 RepID=A0ABT8WK32_9FLAO|nr:hypothetical protein [Flavivirga jejuensis]MDO5973516.1 hypothetical protein [Flavivirga jejuensis]